MTAMRVEARPLNEHGVPLSRRRHQELPGSQGKLRILETRVHKLGRIAICAKLISVSDGLETELLPDLADAQVIWVEDGLMRIRGIEQVNGVQYAQTWNIKVL